MGDARKLEVGDRVSVMGYARMVSAMNRNHPGELVQARCFDGTRVTVKEEFFATVIFAHGGREWEVYKTACRRLRKKARREFWITVHEDGRAGDVCIKDQSDNMMPGWKCIKVREVRRGRGEKGGEG